MGPSSLGGSSHGNHRFFILPVILWHDKRTVSCAMSDRSKPFVVARNKRIAPKQRRIERVPSGYSVQEFHDDSQGRYWYVVAALEVRAADTRGPNRT